VKLKWYETTARYVLGLIYLFGAVDGAMFLLFGIYIHGKPADKYVFLLTLQATTYFWVFLKIVQAAGAFSLLANYKPALGNALLIPVSSVLCLFYFFELPLLIPTFGLPIIVTTIILTRAYARSYLHLFDDYPLRARTAGAAPSGSPESAARHELSSPGNG
jgi:hypothetical protein